MGKRCVIVFGCGRLFKEREKLISNACDIVALADNDTEKAKSRFSGYNVVSPDELIGYKGIDIIIAADAIIEIGLQIASIIGSDEFHGRVKYIRFEFPVYDWEKEVSEYTSSFKITDDGIRFVLNGTDEIALSDHKLGHKEIYRFVSRKKNPVIDSIIDMPLLPADRVFGIRRGTPIDRYYICKFLDDNRRFIKGRCLEIAENIYTKEYGGKNVTESVILHVEGWGENAIKGNLETGEGIPENAFDSMIITQTLMFIYDVDSTVRNIYKSLKTGGTALITVAGISKIARYDDDNWGMFHSFYMSGLKRAFEPVFGQDNIRIIHYGNVKMSIAFLYGLGVEDLAQSDFDYADEDYPVIYGVIAHK